MSGKITKMSKIKQLMQMRQQGASKREIARQLGLNKETVNTYVQKIKVHELSINEMLELDDPILESKFMAEKWERNSPPMYWRGGSRRLTGWL